MASVRFFYINGYESLRISADSVSPALIESIPIFAPSGLLGLCGHKFLSGPSDSSARIQYRCKVLQLRLCVSLTELDSDVIGVVAVVDSRTCKRDATRVIALSIQRYFCFPSGNEFDRAANPALLTG